MADKISTYIFKQFDSIINNLYWYINDAFFKNGKFLKSYKMAHLDLIGYWDLIVLILFDYPSSILTNLKCSFKNQSKPNYDKANSAK